MADRPQTTLELRTLVLVRELFDGSSLSFPIASPPLVSYAEDEADALVEQRAFLEEYLPQQPPETIARFACPASTELRELDVLIARWDLPARLQLTLPVTICCVVFPHGRDRWVLVPALGHTFHCGPRDDLEEAVAAEVQRMVTAREPTPLELLEVLPPRAHRLEELTLQLDRSSLVVPGRARERRRAIAERKQSADALEVLASVALPLHSADAVLHGPPLVGRERELELLEGLLGGKQRLSALLVGPDLVGKTALFHGWLRRQRAAGREVRAFATSGAQLIAGMSGLGQWQERVRRVMEAADRLDAILYFDNLGDLFADHEGSYVDIAGAMRPYLDEGRVRIVGELRPELLDLLEGRHPAFLGSLQRVRLDAMNAEQSRAVLEARLAHAARHEPHRPNLALEAIQPLIDLVERYQPYLPHPGKAVRLFEELRAVGEHAHAATPTPIGESQLLELFSLQSGIPLFLLRQDRALKLADLVAAFSKQLAGQQEAVRSVAETICVVKARLQPPGKPLATFLFIGPTGVGKTELARRLAAYLFGSEQRLARFDMSEFMDAGAAQRLIRGAERAEGLLTRRVRQQPFCVLLLDEIEKAHPAVFDLLLQVCGEGRLTDTAGRTAYFHNAIIVMTSNLGASSRRATIGLSATGGADEAYYREQVDRAFRPELVNRIDRIVAFHALSRPQIEQVTRLVLQRLDARRGVAELGLRLRVSDDAVACLAADGYSALYGARQLRRHVEDSLVTPVAEQLARLGPQLRGARLDVTVAGEAREGAQPVAEQAVGPLVLRVLRDGAPRRQRVAQQTPDISALRRTAALFLQLPRVSEVKDRIDLIVAQLSTRKAKELARDKRLAREATELQAEHQRLQQLWQRAAARCADLETVEELCLAALFEEEDVTPFVRDSHECFAQFLEALYFLFLAMGSRRDEATLMLQELDDGRALDLYLAPLLLDLERRRWTAQLHADGSGRLPTDGDWPAERRWSPPRTPQWVLEQLALERRPFRSVLLRCSGAYATALALESGLHRLPGAGGEALLHVSFVAARTRLSDLEWIDQQLRPRTPGVFPVLRRQPPVRHYESPAGPCLVLDGARHADVPLASYWQRYEQIGVQHLLACEVDRRGSIDDAFAPMLYPHEGGA